MWTIKTRLALVTIIVAPILFFVISSQWFLGASGANVRSIFVMHLSVLAGYCAPTLIIGGLVGFIFWSREKFLLAAGIVGGLTAFVLFFSFSTTGSIPGLEAAFGKWTFGDWLLFGVLSGLLLITGLSLWYLGENIGRPLARQAGLFGKRVD